MIEVNIQVRSMGDIDMSDMVSSGREMKILAIILIINYRLSPWIATFGSRGWTNVSLSPEL